MCNEETWCLWWTTLGRVLMVKRTYRVYIRRGLHPPKASTDYYKKQIRHILFYSSSTNSSSCSSITRLISFFSNTVLYQRTLIDIEGRPIKKRSLYSSLQLYYSSNCSLQSRVNAFCHIGSKCEASHCKNLCHIIESNWDSLLVGFFTFKRKVFPG